MEPSGPHLILQLSPGTSRSSYAIGLVHDVPPPDSDHVTNKVQLMDKSISVNCAAYGGAMFINCVVVSLWQSSSAERVHIPLG